MKLKAKGKFKYKIFFNGQFHEIESRAPTYWDFIDELASSTVIELVKEEEQQEAEGRGKSSQHRAVEAVESKWRLSIASIYRRLYGHFSK